MQPIVKNSKLDGTVMYVVFEEELERVKSILEDISNSSGSYAGMEEFRMTLEKQFPEQMWDAYELDILCATQLKSHVLSDVIEDSCYGHVKYNTPAYERAHESCIQRIRENVNKHIFKIVIEYNDKKNLMHPMHNAGIKQLVQAILFLFTKAQLPSATIYKVVPVNINHELFLDQATEE